MILIILCIWHSNEPWKSALTMKDPNYLPVPPIFSIIHPKQSNPIIYDILSVRKTTNQNIHLTQNKNLTLFKNFSARRILHKLNQRKNPQKMKKELFNYCVNENVSQACLILGRIFEFGAYNETENLSLSFFYYNRVLQLNDSSANSPLAFFHRYIYPNMPLSIVQDDFSANFIESILAKSFQFEKGFYRPFSCQKVAKDLIKISEILVEMYFQQPGLYLSAKNYTKKSNESNDDPWSQFQNGVFYLTKPYPSLKEIKKARSFLRKAIDGKCIEALPFFLKLEINLPHQNENTNENKQANNDNKNNENKRTSNDNKNNENKQTINENKQTNNDNKNNENKRTNNDNKNNENKQTINENKQTNNDNKNNEKEQTINDNKQTVNNDDEIKSESSNKQTLNDANKENKNTESKLTNEIGKDNNENNIIIDHKTKIKETAFNFNDDSIFENHILFDQNHPLHPSELLTMIEPLINQGNPESLLLASSHHMRSSVAVAFKPHLSTSIIYAISESNYPPAIHRLAELTYFGLMQIKRSAKDAFIFHLKAAACGYNPSILAASRQLVGGDGICEDCESAVSLLRGIIDSGPWSIFYDKYVKLKHSKVAFLRMIEMGLTPPIWLDENEFFNQSYNKSKIIEFKDKNDCKLISQHEDLLVKFQHFDSNFTKNIFEINSIPLNYRKNQFLKNIRKARKGDGHSLVWLVQNSNISDSLRWLERLESLPINSFYLSHFLKFCITVKGVFNYRKISEFDKLLLKMMISPIFNDILIFAVTFLLIFFSAMKINYIIS